MKRLLLSSIRARTNACAHCGHEIDGSFHNKCRQCKKGICMLCKSKMSTGGEACPNC